MCIRGRHILPLYRPMFLTAGIGTYRLYKYQMAAQGIRKTPRLLLRHGQNPAYVYENCRGCLICDRDSFGIAARVRLPNKWLKPV